MTNGGRTSSLGRSLVLGAVAGAISGLVGVLVVESIVLLVPPTPDANIGLGLFALAATPLLAGLVVWGLLRLFGVPAAGISALVATAVYVVATTMLLSSDTAVVALSPDDPVTAMAWNSVVIGTVPMLVATVVAVLGVQSLPRPSGARTG